MVLVKGEHVIFVVLVTLLTMLTLTSAAPLPFEKYCICNKLYKNYFVGGKDPVMWLDCSASTGYSCSDDKKIYYRYNDPQNIVRLGYTNCPGSTINSLGFLGVWLNTKDIVCACAPGYYINSEAKCEIRNCTVNNGGCDQNCTAGVDGVGVCSCVGGYKLDADESTCIDICGAGNIWNPTTSHCEALPIVSDYQSNLMYKQDGNVTIIGNYFNHTSDVKAFIGGRECNQTFYINQQMLICYYDGMTPPDANGNALFISVLVDDWKRASKGVFFYKQGIYCPKDCSGHGVCDHGNGECTCYEGYDLVDCSVLKEDYDLPPPIADGNGGFIFGKDGKFNFTLSITHVRELDIESNVLKTLLLSNINWNNRTVNIIANNTYYHYQGFWDNESVEFRLDVVYYQNETIVKFAEENITVAQNSIKFQISLLNWEFATKLSVLELVYHTISDESICQGGSTFTMSGDDAPYPYFDIRNRDGSIITARFASRMIVDDRIIKSHIRKLGSDDPLYKLGLIKPIPGKVNNLVVNQIPNFKYNVTIDPNFGVIVGKPMNIDDCDNGSAKDSLGWKLPVIVVCSVVGASIIIVSAVLFFTKSKLVRYKLQSFKLKNFKKDSQQNLG